MRWTWWHVKAERDDNNEPLDRETLPVLPAQLVSLRTSAFIKNLLHPFRAHAAQFWTAEKLDEVEMSIARCAV